MSNQFNEHSVSALCEMMGYSSYDRGGSSKAAGGGGWGALDCYLLAGSSIISSVVVLSQARANCSENLAKGLYLGETPPALRSALQQLDKKIF